MNLNSEVSSRVKFFFLAVGIILTLSLAVLVWTTTNNLISVYNENYQEDMAFRPRSTLPSPRPAQEAEQQPKGDCRDYRNEIYGFVVSLSDKWEGCRVKEVKSGNSLLTVYYNAPTTSQDPSWLGEESDHFSGYASIFAISVYTKEQWLNTSMQTDYSAYTKIAENEQYVYAYAASQNYPKDLRAKKLTQELKAIIASFNLL